MCSRWPSATSCSSGCRLLKKAHLLVRPVKAGAFSGRQSRRGKSQRPRNNDGGVEGNRDLEAHRKAVHGMVSESPGRNANERRGGPDRADPEAEPASRGRRQQDPTQAGCRGGFLRRGGSDSTVTRTRRATGEVLLVPPGKRRSQGGRITGAPGKAAEDERMEDGPVVAEKRGNARGAKGPYWSAMPPARWKAGAR